jgi:hypothetical protein
MSFMSDLLAQPANLPVLAPPYSNTSSPVGS